MKIILISQKESINKHNQNIDILEQSYMDFFQNYYSDYLLITVSNNFTNLSKLLKLENIELIILTGGNNINPKDIKKNNTILDLAPRRDKVENSLISFALKNNTPMLCICRGMQFLNVSLKGALSYNVLNHVGTHSISFRNNIYDINSFHNHGIEVKDLAKDLKKIIVHENIIEAYISEKYKILGIQWHPERKESSFKLFSYLEKKYLGL